MKCKHLLTALLLGLNLSSSLLQAQTMTSDSISATVSSFTLTGELNPITGMPFNTAYFILFGDGQFASGEGQSITRLHKYPAGFSGNARAWFAKKKDSSPPPMLTTPVVFGTTADAFTNPTSNMPNNVKLSTSWIPIGGQQHFVILTIMNKCTSNSEDGSINFYFNAPQISFDPVNFANYNLAAGPISVSSMIPTPNLNFNRYCKWNYTNLAPGEQRHFFVLLNVEANVAAGTSIPYRATITKSDFCGQNHLSNTGNLTATTGIFPHDPNLKFVNNETICSNYPAASLEYHIMFHNEGEGEAEDVWVFDGIDVSHLDINTLTISSSSHPCQLLPIPPGSNKVTVEFPGIQLPGLNQIDPYQYAYSETCGEFFFTINTLPNLSPGVIPNKAQIQFDLQAKIETNTALVYILEKPGNGQCSGGYRTPAILEDSSTLSGLTTCPNPFSDHLKISPSLIPLGESATLEINDLSGKTISRQILFNDATLELETADWPKGLYFIRLQSSQAFQVQRVVKQ